MIRRPAHLRGFTLIELILVLIVLSVVMAIAAPSLRGWGQGQKLRNVADDFLSATRYARTQAVTTATPYAIELNASDNSYVIKSIGPDGVRKEVTGSMGQTTKLPDSYTFKVVSGGGTGQASEGQATAAASLVFYPDSRSTPAVLEFTSPLGDVIKIASDSPAEPFRIVDATK
ncbi:MAG: prepilin-type N-terminal cleavage/methylation domain-containing protein [Tepidisphaeraceae bacterium]